MTDEESFQKLQRSVDELAEAVKALKDQLDRQSTAPYMFYPPTAPSYIPEACKHCSNHPNNGGSGICHCTLGSFTVT